jgi:transposase-like protein
VSQSINNQANHYTAEFKAKVVLEVLSGTKSFSQACRDYEISEQNLSNWKSLFLENAATIFDKAGDRDRKNQPDPNEQKIAELERMVGRMTVELVSMAEVGEPTHNGYAERLIRTIKEAEVRLAEYEDFADANLRIGEFLDEVYIHKRIHSSLGYLTPAEFESQWQSHQATQPFFDC